MVDHERTGTVLRCAGFTSGSDANGWRCCYTLAMDVPEGFPKLDKQTRSWDCRRSDPACTRTKPCLACRGARNRRKGKRRQADARRTLEGLIGARASWSGKLANEETWSHLPVRVEVKSGAQAKPVLTRFLGCEGQSAAARPVGDSRPFAAVFAPDGMADTLWVIRGSELGAFVDALSESM